MKLFLVSFFTFFSFQFCAAQDAATLIAEANRLEAIPNEKAAFNKFKEVLHVQPRNMFALTKCSELCSRIGKREKSKVIRESYYSIAKTYAAAALGVDATNSDANASMAIAMGRFALEKSGKEKIAAVKDIKTYGDLAVKYNPNNFKGWHIIGKWNYEVSSLSGLEKAATKIFYGGLPSASLKTAIQAYEKAKALDPSFMLNYLELAKAYYKNDEKQKAIQALKVVATLPNKTEDDPIVKEEAKNLLKDWE
jgi:tetratricopeptide (TPR) repeat protein